MPAFLTSRFQFEVKYSPILNFSSAYKELFSPYLKLASAFKIHGHNTHQERIDLIFDDENFHIDARWDRLIFVTEGDLGKFSKSNAITKLYFEILNKIESLNTFGQVNNYVAHAVGVRTKEDLAREKIINNMKSNFLKDEVLKFTPNQVDTDIAITFDFEHDDMSHSISIGPYFFESDLMKRNLSPFKTEELSHLNSCNGYMIEYKVSENIKSVNIKNLQKFIANLESEYSKFDI